MSRLHGWTFRTADVSIYIDPSTDLIGSEIEARVDLIVTATRLGGGQFVQTYAAPVVIERAAYSGKIIFVTVGRSTDQGENGHGRTVKGAVEEWASRRAGFVAHTLQQARSALAM